MANLAEQLREEKLQKVDFQKYLDYVADEIRKGKRYVWFGYSTNSTGIHYYDDYNLAEALVKKFRSEGFDVAVTRAGVYGGGALVSFDVKL